MEEDASPSQFEIDTAFAQYAKDGHFDIFHAQKDGVDPQIIEIGVVYNGIKGKIESGEDASIVSPSAWIPVPWNYGNWCGPNNTNNGEPIDALDQACRSHDICLSQGNPECDCDHTFVATFNTIRHTTSGWSRTYLEAAIRAVPAAHGCNF